MRAAFAATTLLLSASAVAQCTVNPPAFVAACPCPGQAPFLTFAGTARIGTVQRLSVQSQLCHPAAGYFIIGLPLSVPIPIPSGLVVCDGDMTPVSTLSIDPIFVTRTFPALPDASGCSSQFLPYFLFVPNQASLVGLTVHAQFFEQLDGHSNAGVPFAASMVVGFTDQP